MKRIALALALVILVSCDKDPIPDPPKMFTVEVINDNPQAGNLLPSGKTEVVLGTNFNLSIVFNFGWEIDSLVINNNKVKINSNPYSVSVNSDIKIRGLFKKNQYGFLCGKAWKSTLDEARRVGTTEWYVQPWTPIGFLFTGTSMYQSFGPDNALIGQGQYTMTKDSLIRGGVRRKILILNNDTLKLQGLIKGDFDLEVRQTYVHP